jgi:hypothetical protein
MSEYRGGYGNQPARYIQAGFERKRYEEKLRITDLAELQLTIDRGEPSSINPNYGEEGFTYFYPETMDLGRVKVSYGEKDWIFEWENRRR